MTKPTGRPRGRPKGAKNKPKLPVVVPKAEQEKRERGAQAAQRMEQAEEVKLAPLEVMLMNMDWAWNKAATMLKSVMDDERAEPEIKLEALKEMARLRDRVQAYAKEAAPYIHPKLHAVAQAPQEAATQAVEIDPLREHLEEMAKFFRLKMNGKAMA